MNLTETHLHQLPGITLGEVTGATADGRPLVRCASRGEPTPALVAAMARTPDWRNCTGVRVVLAFVDGDLERPLVLALLDAPTATSRTATSPTAPIGSTPTATPRTLRVAAGEELRIECGKASISLRADGRVEIRGEHLVSRSRGANKVKGGSVHLN